MSLRGVREADDEAISTLENGATIEDFRLLRRAKALLAMTLLFKLWHLFLGGFFSPFLLSYLLYSSPNFLSL